MRSSAWEERAWAAAGAYVALLLATQNLVLSGYMWVFQQMGGAQAVSRWIYLLFGVATVAFLALVRPRGIRAWGTLVGLAAGLVLLFKDTDVPANLLHFVQYGPLTLLIFWALGKRMAGWARHSATLGLILAVSVVDELVQSLVPHWNEAFPPRRFDPHDIWLNLVAAVTFLLLIAFVWPRPAQGEGALTSAAKSPGRELS
ncbi:MAG TPA: VanZ family protein [Acidobacteriota bacterium]|nr:VanZ family protein [Acidobacteriota bacterium]